jgi:ATP-dependent Clp protease ATP-binding subunit ClpC
MYLAQKSALRLGHEYIGTEHILQGLLDDCGGATEVLRGLGVDINAMQHELQGQVLPGPRPIKGKLPFTPRAKEVIECAMAEANPLQSGGRIADTLDLLVGLLAGPENVAGAILVKYGLTADSVRSEASRFRSNVNLRRSKSLSGRLRRFFRFN